jgi:hypothetical protein
MPIGNDVIKANRKYEGQSCAICKREISLGDLIHICPKCQSINHEECWQKDGGCNSLSCNSLSSGNLRSSSSGSYNNSNSNYGGSPSLGGSNYGNNRTGGFGNSQNSFGNNRNMSSPGANNANMVPCRFCKEPIMRGARKCKHCGEYQNESDRLAQQANNNNSFSEDNNLSVTDWIGILCCPVIGIIQSAIYFSSGKTERGKKLLIGCLVSMFIGFLMKATSTAR